jgi:hypothetical protein
MTHRIALIHPLMPALSAAAAAFKRHWPEARCINLLEDSLPDDLYRLGMAHPDVRRRIAALLDYAKGLEVSGILFTGSGFGPLLDEMGPGLGVPLLKPNQAMFDEALAIAAKQPGKRLGMLVSFPAAAEAMRLDFEATRSAAGVEVELEFGMVPAAMDCLRVGDAAGHNRLVAEAAKSLAGCSAVMLAQFSMAQAGDAVAAAIPVPVLSSPDSAVKKLRRVITGA